MLLKDELKTFYLSCCLLIEKNLKLTTMADNSILLDETKQGEHLNSSATDRSYTSTVAKDYVNQRKEKAQKQAHDEKNGISKAKLNEHKWDEMVSYKYAIF